MSINFNFSNVRDHARVTTNPHRPDEWHPVADALVWLSLICGFNEITKKNLKQVSDRIMIWQKVSGPYFSHGHYLTPADVERFVGMRTNASPLTDVQFDKKMAAVLRDTLTQTRWQDMKPMLEIIGEYDPPSTPEVVATAEDAPF